MMEDVRIQFRTYYGQQGRSIQGSHTHPPKRSGRRPKAPVKSALLQLTRPLRRVVDRVFPFADARAAYRHLHAAAHFGKVVISLA